MKIVHAVYAAVRVYEYAGFWNRIYCWSLDFSTVLR